MPTYTHYINGHVSLTKKNRSILALTKALTITLANKSSSAGPMKTFHITSRSRSCSHEKWGGHPEYQMQIWCLFSIEIACPVPMMYLNATLPNSHATKSTLLCFNPLTANLFNPNFHPLEVVSRWRDPQLQVSKNYSDLTKWRSTVFKSCWLMSHFIFSMFKRWYLMF